jgi:hypothetical protein
MDNRHLQEKFNLLGARVKVANDLLGSRSFVIDVATDRKGEYFDIQVVQDRDVQIQPLDVRPELRHLLLRADGQKFLCGHDERHWFVAAVPGDSASTVKTALEALKPWAVRQQESVKGVKLAKRLRRKNEAYIRQGEWFFVPAPHVQIPESWALRNEPLSRGQGSKPHRCEYLYRVGGRGVYVCRQYPRGVSQEKYQRIRASNPRAGAWDWRFMQVGATAYARGRVSHQDHKTIRLKCWHQVFMNTEHQAPASRNILFLD